MDDIDELKFEQKQKILREVILGIDPESEELLPAKEWRERCEADCKKIRAAGGMPEMPAD